MISTQNNLNWRIEMLDDISRLIVSAMITRQPFVAPAMVVPNRGYSEVKKNTTRKMFKINQRMQRKARSCKARG